MTFACAAVIQSCEPQRPRLPAQAHAHTQTHVLRLTQIAPCPPNSAEGALVSRCAIDGVRGIASIQCHAALGHAITSAGVMDSAPKTLENEPVARRQPGGNPRLKHVVSDVRRKNGRDELAGVPTSAPLRGRLNASAAVWNDHGGLAQWRRHKRHLEPTRLVSPSLKLNLAECGGAGLNRNRIFWDTARPNKCATSDV